MQTIKLKGNRHAELMVTGDDGFPLITGVITRTKATDHGNFLRDLVLEVAPHAYTANGQGARRLTPVELVDYCLETTKLVQKALSNDGSLGLTVPSFETLAHKLRMAGGDAADVVQLFDVNNDDEDGAA